MTACTQAGDVQVFDFFCQTPGTQKDQAEIEFFPVEVDFGTTTEEFHIGAGAVGVPGSISGVFSIYEKLCSLPLKVLAEPAIEMAKSGVAVDDFSAMILNSWSPSSNRQMKVRSSISGMVN